MENDFISGCFFSDNERFADIINGIGCAGQVLRKRSSASHESLHHSVQGSRRWRRKKVRARGRRGAVKRRRKTLYRDLVRKTPFGVNFAIVGIENQDEIDYSLPIRVMCYDAGAYENQALGIRKAVRKKGKGLTAGEYLYGFEKKSRLYPTVTFVLYYGEKEWDGPRDIHGMLDFTNIPEILREKISNYRIYIIEVRKLADTDVFRTDVKQVFDYIRFSGDKKKLRELVAKDAAYTCLEEDAYDMVTAYAGEEEMFGKKGKHKKGGKVNMSKGLREWLGERGVCRRDCKGEGRRESRREGRNAGGER